MAPKADPAFPFQGRPGLLYLDNGPVAKSRVFQTVMLGLGIAWQTHRAAGKDGTRVTARAKGKVERPFRTVKEAHEILYHFHTPDTEAQANTWLLRYLMRYNAQQHRSQPHSRLEDWLAHLPAEGLREMCTWEQFCRLAREPERRKVSVDARVTIAGTAYEVDPQLAGEVVLLLWGLFDDALYVEYEGERSGPYFPVSGPIPLHRYRTFKRGKREERADRIRHVADQLTLPLAALAGDDLRLHSPTMPLTLPKQAFDADTLEYHFPTPVAAKLAIAEDLGVPLAKLTPDDRAFIDHVLAETRMRRLVLRRVRDHFRAQPSGEGHAG
jgi:hypothetical protein